MISVKSDDDLVYGTTDVETPNIEDIISLCVKKARELWGDLPVVVEARSWDMSYGDTHDDSFVFVRPDMKRYKMIQRLIKAKAKNQ